MTQEVNDLPGEDFSCWLVGQFTSDGSVWAGVGLAAHFGLVGAGADSGFCELPKRGGGG